jgi:hypothetical protein
MTLHKLENHDPKVHTAFMRQALHDIVDHLRKDIDQINEPRARAMFETSAEVLQGLIKTYEDYDAGKELAFKQPHTH